MGGVFSLVMIGHTLYNNKLDEDLEAVTNPTQAILLPATTTHSQRLAEEERLRPPSPISRPTVQFQEIAPENRCDPRTPAYKPCIRICEHACQVTVNFKDHDECRKGQSSVIWRGTCRDNFENAKDNIKYGVHGCDNFDIYWEDMPFGSGAGLKRHLILEKKAYGDYYKFGVSGCERKRAPQDFKSCTAGGGSCTGKMESFRSGGG